MVTDRAVRLLSLLALAAAHSFQQPSAVRQQLSAVSQQLSAADQLLVLIGPAVEGAVSQALAGQQQCGAEAGQRALTELGRLQQRLEEVVRDVAALQQAGSAVQTSSRQPSQQQPSQQQPSQQQPSQQQPSQQQPEQQQPEQQQPSQQQPSQQQPSQQQPEPQPEPEPKQQPACEAESEPACEVQPVPLPVVAAPHKEPKKRACARSCLQLRDQGGEPQDGFYWLTGLPVPVLCDFSHDGGGWTLLLTATSGDGWDLLSVLERNERSPSLTDNYSILRYADAIRDLGSGSRFAYRIEAQGETGRRRWGGVWLAPRRYSFVDETGSQTEVRLVRRFDKWAYKDVGIEKRMPWLRIQGGDTTVLTTSDVGGGNWWGTLVTHHHDSSYRHSPWMNGEAVQSGTVLYWMREEEL